MKLYKIRDWDSLYENNRSRQVKDLSWVPIQNKLDGENFSMIMAHPQGAVIFSSFILMVEVASRCTPRGTLVRGNGLPHDVRSMSAKCRCPDVWFKVGFEYLEKHTDWLIVEDVADGRQEGDVKASGGRQSGDEEQKGMEENGKNRIEPPVLLKKDRLTEDTKVVLRFLNEKTKREFRESKNSLTPIFERLSEKDVTVEGVKKMICRQVDMWAGTDMAEYLRPETLFGEKKFNSYYAARELAPVQRQNGNGHISPIQRKIALEELIANHPARPGSDYGEKPTPEQRADFRKLNADLDTVVRIIAAGGRQ